MAMAVEALALILRVSVEVNEMGFLVRLKRVELESVSVLLAMGESVREDRSQRGHDASLDFEVGLFVLSHRRE